MPAGLNMITKPVGLSNTTNGVRAETRYSYDAIDRRTGEHLWTFESATTPYSSTAIAPDVYLDESVYRSGTITTPTNIALAGLNGGASTAAYSGTAQLVDGLGQLSAVYEYDNAGAGFTVTRYGYTTSGLLDTVTGPAGAVTDLDHDMLGRRTRPVDPDQGTSTATYDGWGNTITRTDAKNRVVHHAYDKLNRLVAQRQTNATGLFTGRWFYDKTGEAGLLDYAVSYDSAGTNAYTLDIIATDVTTATAAPAIGSAGAGVVGGVGGVGAEHGVEDVAARRARHMMAALWRLPSALLRA